MGKRWRIHDLPLDLELFRGEKLSNDVIVDKNQTLLKTYIKLDYFTEDDLLEGLSVPDNLLDICFPYRRREIMGDFSPLINSLIKKQNELADEF